MIDHVGGIEYLGQTTNTPAALTVNLKHFEWICNFESPSVTVPIKHCCFAIS